MSIGDSISLVERTISVERNSILDSDEFDEVSILVANISISMTKKENVEETFQSAIEQQDGLLRAVMIDTYRNLIASNHTRYRKDGGKSAALQAAANGYADQGTLPKFVPCGNTFNASGTLVYNVLKHSSDDKIGYRIMGAILIKMLEIGALPTPRTPSLPFWIMPSREKLRMMGNSDANTDDDWIEGLLHAPETAKQEDFGSYPGSGEADDQPQYLASNVDSRESAYQLIKKRRGQAAFRNALLERYNNTCMVSGCQITEVLEAAHIKPYRGENDNHPENGLLLRTDLHTLFDLDLMGVDPETLTIRFHPSVKGDKMYRDLADKRLKNLYAKPSVDALKARWELFQKRLSE